MPPDAPTSIAAGSAGRLPADALPTFGGLPAWRLLLLAEIKNFAALRRYLGHARSDFLIKDVATIVGRCLPGVRVSPIGRSLVEIAFEGALPSEAELAINALRDRFREAVDVDGELHCLEMVLAGVAVPSHECDEVRLAEAAEAALDAAKTENRDVFRDLSRVEQTFDRTSLARSLARAIGNDEVFLQYQPKVHLRRQTIVSIEALVRWDHPKRGLILPGDFIPIAEETGQIADLTIWTIQRAIADQQLLAGAGHDLPIFLNMSGMLLADRRFVDQVCDLLSGVSAKIGFEITETAVIRDPDSAIQHLHRFADIGVTLAIDDYGAGLSSLAYLKQLPARELKIDKMFVLELTSSNRDPLIVRSTIDLAHALDMEVTAEGVETPAAMALLSVMGCDMAQGFLISRPIGLTALHQYLDQDRHLTAAAATRPTFGRPESFWKRA